MAALITANAFLRDFLEAAPLNPLGPGEPKQELVTKLRATKPQDVFGGAPTRDDRMASAVFAGLYLLADDLNRSHEISQEIATPTGSYWHGIMHRREPDYGNAKYWFHRVGRHPVYDEVAVAAQEFFAEHAGELAGAADKTEFLRAKVWNAESFVDLCATAAKKAARGRLSESASPQSEVRVWGLEKLCRRIQRRECELLLDYCYRQALGG
jgi:hypothetical protein